MKRILLSAAFLLLAKLSFGQTNATDFTANDCSGASHNLFTELNSGKVVVLVWVMPCSSCINDARGAYDASQAFNTSHPGKVIYYMVDDYGNTTCTSLTNWANANFIKPNVTIFQNAGTPINEEDYGGTGMPHVVVIGPDKVIYFNKRNGTNNKEAIQNAISMALTKTSVNEPNAGQTGFNVYPNPANEKLTVSYNLSRAAEVKMSVVNTLGQKLLELPAENSTAGNHTCNIDVSKLQTGIYFLQMNAGNGVQLLRFVVARQ